MRGLVGRNFIQKKPFPLPDPFLFPRHLTSPPDRGARRQWRAGGEGGAPDGEASNCEVRSRIPMGRLRCTAAKFEQLPFSCTVVHLPWEFDAQSSRMWVRSLPMNYYQWCSWKVWLTFCIVQLASMFQLTVFVALFSFLSALDATFWFSIMPVLSYSFWDQILLTSFCCSSCYWLPSVFYLLNVNSCLCSAKFKPLAECLQVLEFGL